MTPVRGLPAGPLVAFYGDDFTGSSAAMEAFAWQGLSTVLFLGVPSPARLAEFAGYRCIGIAGIARSQSPEWMDEHLPAIFRLLADTGAPIVQYKVCSTFDSSPQTGSIGRATDIGARLFPGPIPMLAGDLGMGRLQAFGHLFAQANGTYYRLDRHPTMANHPTTPMRESNLARHLAHQTTLPVTNVSFLQLKAPGIAKSLRGDHDTRILSIDLLDQDSSCAAGGIIWSLAEQQTFVIGSQGVQAALASYWRAEGLLTDPPVRTSVGPVDRIAVVSGSVSPMTGVQIDYAQANGFEAIRLDLAAVTDARAWKAELDVAVLRAKVALSEGRDPVVFTARGPDDPAVGALRELVQANTSLLGSVNDSIGAGLGRILDRLIAETGLKRVVLSGGDTSSHAALQLGIDALTSVGKLAPGGPLCRAHSQDAARDGVEIAMKGGQVGNADYFVTARDGKSSR